MPNHEHIPADTITKFLHTTRRHLGLPTPSSAILFRRLSPLLRSLLIVGSLGTALAHPALASETARQPDEREATEKSDCNTAKREAGSATRSPSSKRQDDFSLN